MNRRPKYVAEIGNVRETAVQGVADLGFWSDQLAKQNLRPVEHKGHARLVLTGVAARWMGISFCELSIAVFARDESSNAEGDRLYLPQAFNSSRFFAFCERQFFRTPYHHADVSVNVQLPASLRVRTSEGESLQIHMSDSTSRESVCSVDESREVPIYLPHALASVTGEGGQFWAKLAGPSQTYPFTRSDAVEIVPTRSNSIMSWLIESEFAGTEWNIRHAGTHARSKTVRRGSV